MAKIKKLTIAEAQKIAAGEVVERPANVIKELIENSIDAGATAISVHIEDGGKKLIRIVDNGCGMSQEDAHLCFEQHATSKISSVNDLETISTHGFRGEALASIASVSSVTLITAEKNNLNADGIKLELKAGNVTNKEIVTATAGTDITIENIFFNIPARQKFLKKKETEQRQIAQLLHACCLDYLNIHFKYFVNDRTIISCPATTNIIDRVAQLWDHRFSEQMLQIDQKDSDTTISGAISNHQYFRYDRNNIFLFVNKRWVKDQQLTRALLRGYQNVLPPARYPAAFLFIEVDPKEVDINIHPRKEEVQFLHPRRIATRVQTAVKTTLESHLSSQLKQTVEIRPQERTLPKPFFPEPQKIVSNTFSKLPNPFSEKEQTQTFIPQPPVEEKNQTIEPKQEFNIIGQYKKTYILLERENGLFFVDQHAAHERILYELFSTRFEDVATVKLMFPEIIDVSHNDMILLSDHLQLFTQNGIEIEPFGENQLIIQSTPVHIKNINLREFILEVASWIHENQNVEKETLFKALHEKMRAQMACKAAIKAGDVLNQQQMENLINDLYKIENRLTCPHGRPTGWLLNVYDLEKKFKRAL